MRIETSYEIGGYSFFISKNVSDLASVLNLFDDDDIITAFVKR